MPLEITFVRHAQSTSNVEKRWQGHGNAPLSAHGREQAAALGQRLAGARYDVAVSSDLRRAAETAEALGQDVELDADWREVNVGAWEGLTRDQVIERFPEQLNALARGDDVRIGGGESWSDVFARVDAALDRVRTRLHQNGGQRALVVSHGGVIHGLIAGLLGIRDRRPRPIGRLANTAMTVVRLDAEHADLQVYNDAAHVAPISPWTHERLDKGDAVLSLVAGAGADDEHEEDELESLTRWYHGLELVYGAPNTRGLAHALSERLGAQLGGAADGLEPDDGTSLRTTIDVLSRRHAGKRIGIVADAGAIARYANELMGSAEVPRVQRPRSAGVSHVVATSRGHTFADYHVGLRRDV